ncbi:MAG: hypothetical protein IJ930_03690 [Lachnospiraceae bacterium]|nr:hypothetical protein [Lachnospiraceae bacterium]
MRRVLMLANVVSGTASAGHHAFKIVELLSRQDCIVTLYPIDPRHDLTAEKAISETKGLFDTVVCYGGDGTMNHVVNTLINEKLQVPICYIPGGSTNDFAKSIYNGTVPSLEKICRTLTDGKLFYYDIGSLNDTYFNYVAAFGAFTHVSYSTSQNVKNAIGYGAYILGVLAAIPESIGYRTHVRLEYDDGVLENDCFIGAVSNTTAVGGMKPVVLNNAELNDGLFEILLIKTPADIAELNDTLTQLTRGNTDNNLVTVVQTKKARFTFDSEVSWTLDGEDGGSWSEVEFSVHPGAIPILLPDGGSGKKA